MVHLLRWSLFTFGLIFFSLGISLAINVQHLGVQAWDVLHVAFYDRFGLSIGSWAIILGLVLVGITYILDKSYIKIGTFINILTVGSFVDLFLWLDFLPKASHSWTDILIIMSGIVIMGLAGGMYNAGGVGSGPRDGFMLVISEKWNITVRKIRIIIESLVLLTGLLLGGPVFIFTFVFTFIQSPLFQFAYEGLDKLVKKYEYSHNSRSLASKNAM